MPSLLARAARGFARVLTAPFRGLRSLYRWLTRSNKQPCPTTSTGANTAATSTALASVCGASATAANERPPPRQVTSRTPPPSPSKGEGRGNSRSRAYNPLKVRSHWDPNHPQGCRPPAATPTARQLF